MRFKALPILHDKCLFVCNAYLAPTQMEKHALKLLLAAVLRHLVRLLHQLICLLRCLAYLLKVYAERARYYAAVVARSPMVLQINAWMDRFAKRPWFRRCRNALYHCVAFIVGSTFEEERVEFTARKLVKNDAYRDRLLVPEIQDLVALSDALRLTLPQRKAYFQCFLHVDFMRRSSVSRAELLRYCSLRSTPLTNFLLPSSQEATHRETAPNRWDIMQLMAVCFSICTSTIVELVQLAVVEATRSQDTKTDESGNEDSMLEQIEKEDITEPRKGGEVRNDNQAHKGDYSICEQIDQCLAFFIGVPDPVERSLQKLLTTLYDDTHTTDQYESNESTGLRNKFQDIHGVTTIYDVVRLFPVLIFPCIWTQRVLRTRILGVKTWYSLQQRRRQLQPHLPSGALFLSVADIIAASQVQLQQKPNREYEILTPTSDQESTPLTMLLNSGWGSRSDHSTSSKTSTPRKIVPSAGSEHPKSDAESSSYAIDEPDSLRLTFDQCSTSEEAWRVSANHALASVHIQCLLEETPATIDELQAEFERVTAQIFAGELSTEHAERIRQRLVREYGYRFAHCLLARSNMKELSYASKTPRDERRAKQRYAKAWRGSGLIEDKVIYWKEFDDPVTKRAFYYNIRTGESRWEKPANFVGKKKLKRRRKAKPKTINQPPEPRASTGSPAPQPQDI